MIGARAKVLIDSMGAAEQSTEARSDNTFVRYDSWVKDALWRVKYFVGEVDACLKHVQDCEYGQYLANVLK